MNLAGVPLLALLFLSGLAVVALTRRRRVRRAGLAVVIIAVTVAGVFLWQAHRWERGFVQIHAGDSRELVRKVMGTPTEVTDAKIGIYGSQRVVTDRVPGCTEQFWYYPFFTPECWWIAFDAQGMVLDTCHYISP